MSDKEKDTRKVIDIDLAESRIEIKQLPGDLEFEGGRGLTSKCISKETDPGVHPLSEDNNFYIAPGLLSGTSCPNSGRCSMGAKSPLTGGIKETNTGGTLATYLARMGIALIKIKGRSKKENVICIEDIPEEEGNNNIKHRFPQPLNRHRLTTPHYSRYSAITGHYHSYKQQLQQNYDG